MEAGTGSFEKCDHGNDYSAASMRKVRQREGGEWRVKAQAAEQKNTKLEAQLTELRDTIEGIKQRHALERSRWLDVGSGLGPRTTSDTR